MKFIGIDLGWQSGPSGLCCLSLQAGEQSGQLRLEQLDRLSSLTETLAWVDAIAPAETAAMVAVDAPTLIPNATGMRLPDRLAHRHFGKYHAGAYPANQARPFAQRLVQFGHELERRGFSHAPTVDPQRPGRYQIEVFPHPAMVQLFSLPQILKYKKGRVAERRRGLLQLRAYLLTDLPRLSPPLLLADLPEIPHRGVELKAVEDRLDSLICAYVAAHWWYWGHLRNQVLGDRSSGYIVVPCPPTAPVQPLAQVAKEGLSE